MQLRRATFWDFCSRLSDHFNVDASSFRMLVTETEKARVQVTRIARHKGMLVHTCTLAIAVDDQCSCLGQ